MKIDRDFIPIVLIVALVVIWFSSKPWTDPQAIAIAGDVLKVGLGGVLGYMTKGIADGVDTTSSDGEVQKLQDENQRLSAELDALKEHNGL